MVKVEELNRLDRDAFVESLTGLFENSPWVATRVADKRPFADRDALYAALCQTVLQASAEEKLSLIRAHPDLAGPERLTRESKSEQAVAGLSELAPEDAERFRHYNSRYRERFGFPFVICARLNRKQAILDAFPLRLRNSAEQELAIALQEVFKIADLRMKDLVE